MALDIKTFENIVPSRFLSFTIPNPARHAHLLRVAVLDSPSEPSDPVRVAALFVPQNRESDWVFSTESGQRQLLLSTPGISRLILIGKNPVNGVDSAVIYCSVEKDSPYFKNLESSLQPLLIALSPNICHKDEFFDIPILVYEDALVCRLVLEQCVGVFVGEMLVEDVEMEVDSGLGDNCTVREFRRRLRFKRMPNLVQTEIRIVPEPGVDLNCAKIGSGEVRFMPDLRSLVQEYLIAMVASLSVIGPYIEEKIKNGSRPTALCLGVGGGALLGFLKTQLGFQVVGVEMDEEVLRVAKRYFGLEDCGVRISVGDATEFAVKLALAEKEKDVCHSNQRSESDAKKFDIVAVDLDSPDAAANGLSAPPQEFVSRQILLACRYLLHDFGIVAVNVIPLQRSSYDTLIRQFQEVFHELYEIDVGDGDSFVLIATASPLQWSDCGSQKKKNDFLEKLRVTILGKYLNSIRKI